MTLSKSPYPHCSSVPSCIMIGIWLRLGWKIGKRTSVPSTVLKSGGVEVGLWVPTLHQRHLLMSLQVPSPAPGKKGKCTGAMCLYIAPRGPRGCDNLVAVLTPFAFFFAICSVQISNLSNYSVYIRMSIS